MSAPVRFDAFIRDGAIDEKKHEVTALVKTTETDRHRTLFLPEAFARTLPIFLATNPIFLWQHRQRGNPEDALGNAVAGRVTPAGPEVTFRYAVEANPQAARVWGLVVAKVLRAYSIAGWILASVTKLSPQGDVDALPDYARAALLAGECDEVVTDVELAEISQVLIGSDRGALVKAAADGLVPHEMALRVLADIEQAKETTAMSSPTEVRSDAPATDAARAAVLKLRKEAEERAMTPAQMDAAARLMGVMRCLGDCGCCRCSGCDHWDGCKCDTDCCCCGKDGDCGTCSCCVADARAIAACCDILDAVCAGLRAKYAPPAGSEEPAETEEGSPRPAVRAGAAISKANAEHLSNAKTKCEEAISHLDEVIAQAAADGKKDEQAGDAPDVRAALLALAEEAPDVVRAAMQLVHE